MGGIVMQNSSEVIDKKKKDKKASDASNEANEEMHYRRIYAQHMKAAEDAQIQAAKLQQVIFFGHVFDAYLTLRMFDLNIQRFLSELV